MAKPIAVCMSDIADNYLNMSAQGVELIERANEALWRAKGARRAWVAVSTE